MKTRRVLSAILAMAMVLSTFSFNVFAENEEVSAAVAKIGEVEYLTLQEAFEAIPTSGETVVVDILNNVDLTSTDWPDIDITSYSNTSVIINGNNKTITGLNNSLINSVAQGSGVLEVNNLTISNANIYKVGQTGAVLGNVSEDWETIVDNVNVIDSEIVGTGDVGYTGGIIGTNFVAYGATVTIKDSSVKNTVITGDNAAGGLIGHSYDLVADNTEVTGNTITSNEDRRVQGKANIVGSVAGTLQKPTMIDAVVSGNIVIQKNNPDEIVTTVYGRISGGEVTIIGGKYDNEPISANDKTAKYDTGLYWDNVTGDVKEKVVAKIDDAAYGTFAKALKAAVEGDTIVLHMNVTEMETVVIENAEALTIDLNGKIYNGNLEFANGADVILTNNSEIGGINGNINVIGSEVHKLTVENIKHKGEFTATEKNGIEIKSGHFTTDVSKYLEAGKKLSPSKLQAYAYEVTEKNAGTVDAATSADASKINESVTIESFGDTGIIPDDVETAIKEKDSENIVALEGAANTVEIEETTELTQKIEVAAGELEVDSSAVQLVKRPYLEVQSVEVSDNSVTEIGTTVKYTVKAMCQTVATAEGKGEVNIGEAQVIKVTEPIAMALPVPTGTVGTVTVKHTKDNNEGVFYYEANVEGSVAVFTNPNGFSTFEILSPTDISVVAKVGNSGFATLQAAVDYIDNGGIVSVVNNSTHLVSLSASKTFTVKNEVSETAITVTVNGTEYSIAASGEEEIVYTKPVTSVPSGSSSGGGASYVVEFDTDGGSKIKSIRTRRGNTIKEPTVPEKEGYIFDGWYRDKEFTKKFDFETTLIHSDMTLYAKWIKTDEKEDEKTDEDVAPVLPQGTFSDVNANDWYFDAVKYVTDNKLMHGVSEKEFAPNSALTRAMLVTILYRNENEPDVAEKPAFVDIEAGFYYENAVAWAQTNGIVNGVTDTAFAPNENISREQIAVILYRYAQHKGMNAVNMAENLGSFADNDKISEYAVSALNWAVGSGIVNGKSDSILDPTGMATRAEIATILKRFIELNK